MSAVFVPGWGAPASLYAPLLPEGWSALEMPSFGRARGALDAYVLRLLRELEQRGRSTVAGHSMGGAVAVLAAARAPELVERLVLVSPAGLPIVKPLHASARDFASQIRRGLYPARAALRGGVSLASAPRAALRVTRQVRSLDLSCACQRVRAFGVPALVVGCATDTLVRASSSRALATSLGADYRELVDADGHMWMLADPAAFASTLG
jgi:pimeloyl-ACP methyl ester carboxylesterase